MLTICPPNWDLTILKIVSVDMNLLIYIMDYSIKGRGRKENEVEEETSINLREIETFCEIFQRRKIFLKIFISTLWFFEIVSWYIFLA